MAFGSPNPHFARSSSEVFQPSLIPTLRCPLEKANCPKQIVFEALNVLMPYDGCDIIDYVGMPGNLLAPSFVACRGCNSLRSPAL